ncbi:uncharacterized protein MCYG_00971 [Microsporum canis CBS 113480]|uniref:Uncharacterized protein n=1 Tax=Arthroderma otae (strain ATCC MYA-4605 / CBS 113480) TaxID=554155 RepID=C5FE49_ARTOC|nr:uncharacterized protein MCYG_00971 [Microsporum canis CBS 113480]EEQ28083.1 predicted protein [Microsporum canis CBS 113480]
MAVSGDPAFRSMGVGSANVYAATKQLGGPPVACVYGGGRLSTGHQPGSLICDIDRTAPQALGRTTAGDRKARLQQTRMVRKPQRLACLGVKRTGNQYETELIHNRPHLALKKKREEMVRAQVPENQCGFVLASSPSSEMGYVCVVARPLRPYGGTALHPTIAGPIAGGDNDEERLKASPDADKNPLIATNGLIIRMPACKP